VRKRFRRRNYFTRKDFQSRFILRFLIVSSMGSLMAVVLFNVLAYKKINGLLFSMIIPAVNTGSVLFSEALYANIVAAAFVILMFVVTAGGLYNRVVGSLFRIRVDLQRLKAGDLSSPVLLRKEEEFKDFADEINVMVVELNHRFADMKSHVRQIDTAVRDMADAPEKEDGKVLLERIMTHVAALEKEIAGLKR
jgi:methyl-accepting chemotaxis protein